METEVLPGPEVIKHKHKGLIFNLMVILFLGLCLSWLVNVPKRGGNDGPSLIELVLVDLRMGHWTRDY